LVYFLDWRSVVQTLEWSGQAEIVRHLFPVNGVHNLLRGTAEEAGQIQWLFVSNGEESFLDYARIPAFVA
jgi:hypothetical protein